MNVRCGVRDVTPTTTLIWVAAPTLRSLNDRKGQELIDGVLELVDRLRPLHLSIVGGDPLVRYRELESMIPQLLDRGIHVQVVTSAFRPLAASWAGLPHLNVVVSIDGLQPEHDVRRAPATYDRIIKNIAGQNITIHCTVTGQMMKRPGYLKEFLEFWTPRAEIRKVWFSLFTPQIGDRLPEMLQPEERERAIADMMALRKQFPKLDMPEGMIRQFATPPQNPEGMRLRAHDPDPVGGPENQRSFPASSAATRTAVRADASRPWAWRPWRRTKWAASFRWERSSKLRSRSARLGRSAPRRFPP